MYTSNNSSAPLEFQVFEESQSNIRRLKENLPDHLKANLALEVIHRLASRGAEFKHIPYDPSQEQLERLCTALISDDNKAAANIINEVRAEGISPEAIYLKHLGAAAELLGQWWVEDRASFFDVTIGSGRLFAIMRGMKHLFAPDFILDDRSAIFASVPGEDHTLGVRMAADLFRKDGWEIALKVGLNHDELITELQKSPNSLIGLSIGGQHSIDALSKLVVALHICCPNSPILVSGRDIDVLGPLLSLMGVDAYSSDIDEAKEMMSELWDRKVTGKMRE